MSGVFFSGPVGLGGGFDKRGVLYPSLSQMGFDFIECGTFTAHKQNGNPQPRLFRLPKQEALINRMGFNNPGADEAARSFAKQKRNVVRGINIGKSRSAPLDEAAADYVQSLRKLGCFADYIAVNISSPNTPQLRELQEKKNLLRELLSSLQDELKKVRIQEGRAIPLFVKLAPDLSLKELDDILEILLETSVEGVILANTSLDKSQIHSAYSALRKEAGGLSGKPIRKKSTALIRHCFSQAGRKLSIIGAGGIDSGESALEKIQAGASLIQIYTGYVYQGPYLPAKINRYIDAFLEKEGTELKEIIGSQA